MKWICNIFGHKFVVLPLELLPSVLICTRCGNAKHTAGITLHDAGVMTYLVFDQEKKEWVKPVIESGEKVE